MLSGTQVALADGTHRRAELREKAGRLRVVEGLVVTDRDDIAPTQLVEGIGTAPAIAWAPTSSAKLWAFGTGSRSVSDCPDAVR